MQISEVGCYPPRPKHPPSSLCADPPLPLFPFSDFYWGEGGGLYTGYLLVDLHNSSHHTKAQYNNY